MSYWNSENMIFILNFLYIVLSFGYLFLYSGDNKHVFISMRHPDETWYEKTDNVYNFKKGYVLLDVLGCQPIKLIQVVSTSEFHEY